MKPIESGIFFVQNVRASCIHILHVTQQTTQKLGMVLGGYGSPFSFLVSKAFLERWRVKTAGSSASYLEPCLQGIFCLLLLSKRQS